MRIRNIPVGNDRDPDALFDRADNFPVHRRCIHLLARPTVNRQRIRSGLFTGKRRFDSVFVSGIEPGAALNGKRQAVRRKRGLARLYNIV